MRWPPSKGVLIRLFIYLPLIGYLGWRVLVDRTPQEAPAADTKAFPTRTFTTEDGKQFDVIQMTPDEAQQMMGRPLPTPDEAEARAQDGSPGDDPSNAAADE